MYRFLKSSPRARQAGWLLPLVLLALPNCILPAYEWVGFVFDPGQAPQTSAIMCDIPKFKTFVEETDCATPEEEEDLNSLAHAAIGLAETDNNSIALDYSPEALAQCGGKPKKVEFHGPYPEGLTVCLNCETQIAPEKYADGNAVCVAKCIDLTDANEPLPPGGSKKFCEENARVSTNFNKDKCDEGRCFSATAPLAFYDDLRRHPVPVVWDVDPDGFAAAIDNSVGKPEGAPVPVDGIFDSGAASVQKIEGGDAWIEFEAKEAGVSHVVGVANADVSLSGLEIEDISLALSLNYDDNNIYVLQDGVPIPAGPIGQYVPTKRFRLVILDQHDGTAVVSFVRLDEDKCEVGTECKNTEMARSATTVSYPLRVYAMFREAPAQLSDVTMIYIKEKVQP